MPYSNVMTQVVFFLRSRRLKLTTFLIESWLKQKSLIFTNQQLTDMIHTQNGK